MGNKQKVGVFLYFQGWPCGHVCAHMFDHNFCVLRPTQKERTPSNSHPLPIFMQFQRDRARPSNYRINISPSHVHVYVPDLATINPLVIVPTVLRTTRGTNLPAFQRESFEDKDGSMLNVEQLLPYIYPTAGHRSKRTLSD